MVKIGLLISPIRQAFQLRLYRGKRIASLEIARDCLDLKLGSKCMQAWV